jgi:hypothetical protein
MPNFIDNLSGFDEAKEDIEKLHQYLTNHGVNARITEESRRSIFCKFECTEERDNMLILKPFVKTVMVIGLHESRYEKRPAIENHIIAHELMNNDVENQRRYFPLPELQDLGRQALTEGRVPPELLYNEETKNRLSSNYSERLGCTKTVIKLFFAVMLRDPALRQEFNKIFRGITGNNRDIESAEDLYCRIRKKSLGSVIQKYIINILSDKLGMSFNYVLDTPFNRSAGTTSGVDGSDGSGGIPTIIT